MNWMGSGFITSIIYAQNIAGSLIPPPAEDTLGTEDLNIIGTEAGDEIGVS